MTRTRDGERSILTRYLSEIRDRRMLSRDEEVLLALAAQRGDRRAMQELVCANLRFVVRVAHEYRDLGLPFEDLLNEGNVGLLEAARRYDVDRGTKFITFAVWWVRKTILTALTQNANLVRIPEHHLRKLRRIRDAETTLTRVLGRSPEREEVADLLSHGSDRLDETLRVRPRTRSLDEAASRDVEISLGDTLADDSSPTTEEDLLRREARQLVSRALGELDPQERRVLEYRYGLTDEPAMVLREVGRKLGVSRERVRQIEVKATHRLRRILERRLRGRSPRADAARNLRARSLSPAATEPAPA
ncbi:MAG TPA: RNA polymerase sigma factor RpoD/SigA [Candidatus Polarisedimenticolaceae bacterium]|nr:RNA polymerase sigma factor RpoD/SigA [Candidatus Polarisedimenticolaceae bacterium]